jgi:hypothetical protein
MRAAQAFDSDVALPCTAAGDRTATGDGTAAVTAPDRQPHPAGNRASNYTGPATAPRRRPHRSGNRTRPATTPRR